jgi:toxin ParE1/3/4
MAKEGFGKYELSNLAENDLSEIFDYTEREHSFSQAERYLEALENLFELIANNPNLGSNRHEIGEGVLSIVHNKHTVFYQKKRSAIFIIRVLHGRSDIPTHFK